MKLMVLTPDADMMFAGGSVGSFTLGPELENIADLRMNLDDSV